MKKLVILLFFFIPVLCSAQNSSSAVPASRINNSREWLIMLYQDADDYQLEQDIYFDMNEAEMVGSSKDITIVSQIDRYKGGYDGDGDWSGTKRFELSVDDDMDVVSSKMIEDLGEVNMADGNTLAEFVIWAMKKYPAKRYALILSDHGSGWPGGWSDPDPDEGDMLWMFEMATAMEVVLSKTDGNKLDLVGFDACLMGHIEVYACMAPFFKFAVASQETEPGIGWAYQGFLKRLQQNPAMDGAALSKAIIESYIIEDITMSEEYMYRGGRWSKGGSEDEYVQYMFSDVTLSAVNLSELGIFQQIFNKFLGDLQKADQSSIALARSYAQGYTNIFDESEPTPYIDLGHFLSLLKEQDPGKKINAGIDRVLTQLKKTVIAEVHGELKSGSTGMSIHFPNSSIYQADWGGMVSYSYSIPGFVTGSYWDEFLLFHYSGEKFTVDTVYIAPEPVSEEKPEIVSNPEESIKPEEVEHIAKPDENTEIEAPGAGAIEITNMKSDKTELTQDDSLILTADIKGSNIAFIYIYLGYVDESDGAVMLTDFDFIEADTSLENSGVYYPDWSAEGVSFELVFEWDPVIFTLDDGESSTFALLNPVSYGSDSDSAIYSVEGNYYTASEDENRYAVIYFDGTGKIKDIYAYTGSYGLGAPHEITPSPNDLFAPYYFWITWNENDEPETTQYLGDYMSFAGPGIEWFDEAAFVGQYVIGFIVEDMDGNQTGHFIDIEVID